MELQEYWGAGGRRCGSWEAAPAVGSYLCTACDALPAHARLGHDRVWMSELVPTAVACEADGAVLSATCDADIDIHGANPLARRHALVPVAPIGSEAATAAVEAVLFGTGEAAAASEADELDVAAEQQLLALELDFFLRFRPLLSASFSSVLRLGELEARLHDGVGLDLDGIAGAIGELMSVADRFTTVVDGVKGWAVRNKPLPRSVEDVVDKLNCYWFKLMLRGFVHAHYYILKLELERPSAMIAAVIEPEGVVVDGAEQADASPPDNIGRKNRCKERDYFHITPAVNGEPAKAKCIDCDTQVVFSHGTSVLRKHRNSTRCKNKRAAIEEVEPNYPSPYSTQNGAIISTNASEGTKRMTKNLLTTITLDWVKVQFLKSIHGIALEFGCFGAILESFQPGQHNGWLEVGIACATDKLKAKVEMMEMLVNGVNGRAVGNKPLAHSPVLVEQLDCCRLQQQVQGGMLSPAIEPEGMDGEEDRDEAMQVGASSSSIPNNSVRKNRSKARDFFQFMPAVNGEAAKAKCVDCGTEVQWGHGTSVLHKHRNSASCKGKRAAIEETSDSSRNGAHF